MVHSYYYEKLFEIQPSKMEGMYTPLVACQGGKGYRQLIGSTVVGVKLDLKVFDVEVKAIQYPWLDLNSELERLGFGVLRTDNLYQFKDWNLGVLESSKISLKQAYCCKILSV